MADRHGPCTKLHWGYRCTREDGHSGICHLDPEGCICGLNDPRCEGATCVLEPNELARWGGWMPGLLGHGGALQEAVKILTERTDGVETGEPRGPVHSCKNCAHLAKDSCDDPCAGCTVRWRSGVSDRWEPALGVKTGGGDDGR